MRASQTLPLQDEDEFLALGRILTDQGFRDLFSHDPQQAALKLHVSLSDEAIARIQSRLARMEAMDTQERGAFTTKLNSLERWKQA